MQYECTNCEWYGFPQDADTPEPNNDSKVSLRETKPICPECGNNLEEL